MITMTCQMTYRKVLSIKIAVIKTFAHLSVMWPAIPCRYFWFRLLCTAAWRSLPCLRTFALLRLVELVRGTWFAHQEPSRRLWRYQRTHQRRTVWCLKAEHRPPVAVSFLLQTRRSWWQKSEQRQRWALTFLCTIPWYLHWRWFSWRNPTFHCTCRWFGVEPWLCRTDAERRRIRIIKIVIKV